MTLLFIFRRVMRRKFIGGSDQKFLEIGSRNFPPVVDISQRLFIADPISHTSGIDVRSDSALAAIIDHPILRHLELFSTFGTRSSRLLSQAPKRSDPLRYSFSPLEKPA